MDNETGVDPLISPDTTTPAHAAPVAPVITPSTAFNASTPLANGSSRPPLDSASRYWLRAGLRFFGWTIAVLAVPIGLAISYLASWFGNCKLGFFGDLGPLSGAERFELWDFVGPMIGLAIATIPWLIVWRRTLSTRKRTASWVTVAICVSIVFFLIYLPQLTDAEAHWRATC